MGVQINGDTGNVIATKGTFSGDVGIGGTLTYEDVTNIDSVGLITARSGIEIGASPGVAASISVDGNMIVSGITTIGGVVNASSDIKVGSGVTVGKDGDIFATGVTTSSTVKVGGGVTISESGIEASGIGITVANINGGQIGGRRNLIINGAMNVAQRATSYSGNSGGLQTVDRIVVDFTGLDEAPTYAQVDVASGTTPYTLGFRKAYKITNGNQTGGVAAADRYQFFTKLEGQDVANSGWNYTSASSFITLSFWVKSSVAQNFYGYLRTKDGTGQLYTFETGSLTADTWTKVIKTIPGNSNITIDNDTGEGLQINFNQYFGTDHTDSGVSLNTWGAYSSATRTPDYTSTFFTTNDATIEYTGIQLEVGSQATDFEHRSFGEELKLCERYCETLLEGEGGGAYMSNSVAYATNELYAIVRFKTEKRATPTLVQTTGSNYYTNYSNNTGVSFNSFDGLSWPNKRATAIYNNGSSVTAGHAGLLGSNNTSAKIYVEAEL
mgnify:CR=1 FL=1